MWSGPKVVFTKADGADPTQAANQDRLTSNVWLTRGGSQGLYNIAKEAFFTHSVSPVDTEWASGTTANYASLTYTDWETWARSVGNPPATPGVNAVLHLKTDNIYLDIKFLSWSQRSGGFSYERSTPGASPINGTCGSANGGTFTTAPTANLCSAGTATAVSGTGPWTWSCIGSNGGTTANCSANVGTPTCTLSANPASIVAGGTSTLTASCSPAATSYVWSANTGFGRTVTTGTVSPTVTTSYTVAGVNSAGTGATVSATVTVVASPSAT